MTSVPVSLLYAGIFGLLLVILSFNMTKYWVRATGLAKQNDPDLKRAEALVSSFTDYVPLALLLIGGAEIRGAPSFAVHLLGGALIVARLMHAFGSNRMPGADALRFLGSQLTYLVITVASFCCLFFYAMPILPMAGKFF